jgi:hypothetical protein
MLIVGHVIQLEMQLEYSTTLFAPSDKPDKVHVWEILVVHWLLVATLLEQSVGVLLALKVSQMSLLVFHLIVLGLLESLDK